MCTYVIHPDNNTGNGMIWKLLCYNLETRELLFRMQYSRYTKWQFRIMHVVVYIYIYIYICMYEYYMAW